MMLATVAGGQGTNLVLGTTNGVVFIVVAAVAVCLIAYMRMIFLNFEISFTDVMRGKVPLGTKLAIPLAVMMFGAMLSLGPVWYWRIIGGHRIMPDIVVFLLLAGIILLIDGALWLIRVLTIYRQGEWPWVVTALVVFFYIAGSILNLPA